jgi:hypothetical protein
MNLDAWNGIVSELSNPDVPTCVEAASKLYTGAAPPTLQGMMCPKEGNRDVVVRLTAPDQKCIRVVTVSDN